MKLLITGGAGFIGSHFVKHMLEDRANAVVNVDALTYAGNLQNLKDVLYNPRHTFIRADITDEAAMRKVFDMGMDAVVNLAAETHVDRSISNPSSFLRTNVLGTQTLLSLAKEYGTKRFLQVSTDEVYGSLGNEGQFSEQSQLNPSSPYSASKAAADLMVLAYCRTYGMDALITRCTNNYGSNQHSEKLIPRCILNVLHGEKIPVYGSGCNVRDWLYVIDHCTALESVLKRGKTGEIYNIGSNNEHTNLDVIYHLLKIMRQPRSMIEFVQDRPGHDFRYAIDASKLRSLGWRSSCEFEEGLIKTVKWYTNNQEWEAEAVQL